LFSPPLPLPTVHFHIPPRQTDLTPTLGLLLAGIDQAQSFTPYLPWPHSDPIASPIVRRAPGDHDRSQARPSVQANPRPGVRHGIAPLTVCPVLRIGPPHSQLHRPLPAARLETRNSRPRPHPQPRGLTATDERPLLPEQEIGFSEQLQCELTLPSVVGCFAVDSSALRPLQHFHLRT
jgi:hypothetical protein